MFNKNNQKPRLHKKVGKKQKFNQTLLYYAPYLILLSFILDAGTFILIIWGIL
jgi:hypothetical protein